MMGLSDFMPTLPLKHRTGVDVYAAGTPVAYLSDTFFALVTGTSQPFDNLKGLVSLAKTNPGKVSYASSGVGPSNHIVGERFKQVSDIEMSHIAYQGDSAMLADVINGRVTVGLGGAVALEMVRAGKLKAIGIVAPQRNKLAPNIPTLMEQGADVGLMPWNVLVRPKGLSTAQLNAVIGQEKLVGREVIRRANIQLDGGTCRLAAYAQLHRARSSPMLGAHDTDPTSLPRRSGRLRLQHLPRR
jgi:tripartite-type tricarboxylate transporter receptor subunit TctC